jgi:hypothetical protein
MGTSKFLPGPRVGPWRSASYGLSRWLKGAGSWSSLSNRYGELVDHRHSPVWDAAAFTKVHKIVANYLAALSEALRVDCDAFGLLGSLLGAEATL